MAEMYEAWMSGQAPLSSIRDYLNTNMSPPIQVSVSDPIYPPEFGPYANASNVAGTSTVRPLSRPMTSNPFFVPTVPTNSVPQPIMEPQSKSDPPPKVQYDRDYTLEVTFKISGSYPYTHQYSSPVEAEKDVKNEEHEEMARKMKSLEQSVRDMQGLGGHKNVSFNDLCMFPTVIYPSVLKLQSSRNMMDMEIL
ncbi:hypothetical protein KY285_034320 [Solanum tuberosum]|nr:hypothetical protein KY284_034269 [Solanum tuberosum]KAH0649072.1 hypothetical protein KY285_034320 [Solanum tuberosum]